MHDLTKQGTSKKMAEWLDFAITKGSNNSELLQEKSRIKIVEMKLVKTLINK